MSSNLENIAKAMIESPKGILALDWSIDHATKEFEKAGFESNKETRRKYRQMFVTSPGLEKYVSAAILHPETAEQKLDSGTTFPEHLKSLGIVPGVRVDTGADSFGEEGKEYLTKGMDELDQNLKKFKSLGLKFAKWRALIFIDEVRPSKEALEKNTDLLAEYAEICQKHGFVPIVEPDVLIKGNHTMAKSETVNKDTLRLLFEKLKDRAVDLNGVILKPSMILPGEDSKVKAEPQEVANATLRVLKEVVPEVPGVVFLSGGQPSEVATANLNKTVELSKSIPWRLTFSFARALQNPAIKIYTGREENIKKAQEAFLKRAKLNSLASLGKYDTSMEGDKLN